MSYGSTDAQNDVMLLGALTALGSCMERYVRCPYGGKLQSPCMQSFIIALPASGKVPCHPYGCLWILSMTSSALNGPKK